jgi:hypothetical protein
MPAHDLPAYRNLLLPLPVPHLVLARFPEKRQYLRCSCPYTFGIGVFLDFYVHEWSVRCLAVPRSARVSRAPQEEVR